MAWRANAFSKPARSVPFLRDLLAPATTAHATPLHLPTAPHPLPFTWITSRVSPVPARDHALTVARRQPPHRAQQQRPHRDDKRCPRMLPPRKVIKRSFSVPVTFHRPSKPLAAVPRGVTCQSTSPGDVDGQHRDVQTPSLELPMHLSPRPCTHPEHRQLLRSSSNAGYPSFRQYLEYHLTRTSMTCRCADKLKVYAGASSKALGSL